MSQQVEPLFLEYDQRRKAFEAQIADFEDDAALTKLEGKIKQRKT